MMSTSANWILIEKGAETTELRSNELLGYSYYVADAAALDWIQFLAQATEKPMLELGKELRNSSENYLDRYSEVTEKLNKEIKNVFWNAFDASTKNPINDRTLYLELALCAYLEKIGQKIYKKIVVANLSGAAIEILKNKIKDVEINTIRVNNNGVFFRRFLRFHKRAFTFIFHWTERKKTLNKIGFNSELKNKKFDVLLRSYFFSGNVASGKYRDSYFEPLVDLLREQNRSYLRFLYLYRSNDQIYDELTTVQEKESTVFLDSVLTLKNLFQIIFGSYRLYFEVKNKLKNTRLLFGNVDVSGLFLEDFKANFSYGSFMDECIHYFAGQWVAKNIQADRVIYPFENLSWERLFLLGLKSGNFKKIGYQHASLPLLSLMTVLPKKEFQGPLPDAIVTTGVETKRILNLDFHYPEKMLREGCSLRHKPAASTVRKNRAENEIVRALVVTSSVRDMTTVLRFFGSSSRQKNSSIVFTLRVHPLFVSERDRLLRDLKLESFFELDKSSSLERSMTSSDLVIYSASTAAIECVMQAGLPLVQLDADDIIPNDPIKNLNDLKRTVSNYSELLATVEKLANLDQESYSKELHLARKYLSEYFEPVSKERLTKFIL